MKVIEVQNLVKHFRVVQKEPGLAAAVRALWRPNWKTIPAVDGISFEVQAGEMIGYIGVNGAGKSTSIKLMTGTLHPSSGSVRVLGRDPFRERVANAREVGAVFGQRSQLWWDLALIESLELLSRIYDIDRPRFRRLLDEYIATLELGELLNVPVRAMSLGQRMRSEIAAALLHEPKVIYLDEPTIGLDVMNKERILDFIRRQRETRNTTVILTTHDLRDIEALCERLIVLEAGKILYDGPRDAVHRLLGAKRILVFQTVSPSGALKLPEGAELTLHEGSALTIHFDPHRTTASQVARAVLDQIEVSDFKLMEPGLTELVKDIYSGALKVPAARGDAPKAVQGAG